MSGKWQRSGDAAFTGATGRRHARPQQAAKHGTQSGYVLHRAFGEPACRACKAAHVKYNSVQRQRRKAIANGEPPPPLPVSNVIAVTS